MNYFKEILDKYNLKQKDVAKILFTTQPAVSNYYKGKRTPGFEEFIKLADYLHISLDELIGREGYKSISDEQAQAIEIIKDQIKKI